MTDLPPVGTIVKAFHQPYKEGGNVPLGYAVVLPHDYAPRVTRQGWEGAGDYAYTRPLESAFHEAVLSQKGWYIGYGEPGVYPFEIPDEDTLPDKLIALAARCLLDRDFIPFVKEDNNV